MDITYYFIGVLTGVSVSTFFVGKELYKYYSKYRIQKKQLERILKLYDKVKKLKNLDSLNSPHLNGSTSFEDSSSITSTS